MKDGVAVENILKSILLKHERLLGLYENIYENFKSIDYTRVDQYVNIIDSSRQYITGITDTQKEIACLKKQLNKYIESDILIDSVIDDYGAGRIKYLNDSINNIIDSLKVYKHKGKLMLEQEMQRIQKDLRNSKLWEHRIEFFDMIS